MRKRVSLITSVYINLRIEAVLKHDIESVIQTMTRVGGKTITRSRVVNA